MKKILLLLVTLVSTFGFSQTIVLTSFASGFSSPVEINHPANDTRLFVVQQGGLIRIVNPTGVVNTTPFLNLSSIISTGGERGLLGLAFHPNYATNGLFFVNYTNSAGNTVIAKYSVNLATTPNVANTTGTILMTISQPYANHNGGCLRFGPDGFLYIGMGDGGNGGDPQGYSQNLTIDTANPTRVFLGKMLRIDVNGTNGALNYSIPSTNPYVGQAGKEEIWARGLRNPWKFSFNRLNGDLWIADVGQQNAEEINKTASPLPNTGLNYGWRCYEGNLSYNTSGCVAQNTMIAPVGQYSHDGGNCSITGGYLYTGSLYPNLLNKYVFADYCVNRIGYLDATTNAISYTETLATNNFITTFGEDVNGELLVLGSNGTMYRVTDTSLATSSFEKNGFSLYPNPAKSEFFIKNSTSVAISNVAVFDVFGKKLLSQNIENENASITTSSLSSGMYLVVVEDNFGKSFTSKLVIQ